ncbi:MAG: radical SAM protein [Planctomycetota bacterium]
MSKDTPGQTASTTPRFRVGGASWLDLLRMTAPMVGRLPVEHLLFLARRLQWEKPRRFAEQVHINSFFPPWPSPAWDRFCRVLIRRSRIPLSVYIAVTAACPYRCAHCSYGRRTGTPLDTDNMVALIGQLKDLGVPMVGFTGGEPLLRDDLEQLVEAAGPDMSTILFTTGHGLDARRATRLARAGLGCATIGIEAADATRHDAVRGASGSFDQARRAVQHCLDAGIFPAVSTVGLHERLVSGQLESMYDLACRWGVGEFRLLAPVPTGALLGQAGVMPSEHDGRAMVDFHRRHNREHTGPTVASFAWLESATMFGCGAGYHHLFVDAHGNACPCDLAPLSLGNVVDESVRAVWSRMARWFARPRRHCLMREVLPRLDPSTETLPLPRPQSEAICTACTHDGTLPDGYRHLLSRTP